MDNFAAVSPIDYKYLQKDEELLEKVKGYSDLDVLEKLSNLVPELLIPRLDLLKEKLSDIAEGNREKGVPKRVDGKHVGKTTVGKIFNVYTEILASRIEDIGKVPLKFTNIEEVRRNNRLSDLAYYLTSTLSAEANIANDIRHHFRSEIEEFTHKEFPDERIGSSTMPHKENPSEYEQIVSLWKAYSPRIVSAVLAQIVEHQGDSTNEFLPDYVFELSCALSYATKSLENALKNLKINV